MATIEVGDLNINLQNIHILLDINISLVMRYYGEPELESHYPENRLQGKMKYIQ